MDALTNVAGEPMGGWLASFGPMGGSFLLAAGEWATLKAKLSLRLRLGAFVRYSRAGGTAEAGRKLLLHFRHFRHPWRSDAEANIRAAAFNSGAGHGPKGTRQEPRVIQLCFRKLPARPRAEWKLS